MYRLAWALAALAVASGVRVVEDGVPRVSRWHASLAGVVFAQQREEAKRKESGYAARDAAAASRPRDASPTLLWAAPPPPDSNLNPPSGECIEGVCKDGEGKFQWGSGDVYEGAWDKEMRPHGKGKYVWHDGESYDGDWDHGLKHGKGEYTYKNGAKYTGKWKNDLQWGPDNNYALSSGEEFMIDIPEGFPPGSDTADRPPE